MARSDAGAGRAGYLPNPAVIDRAAKFFGGQGWRVIAGESVFAREQRSPAPMTATRGTAALRDRPVDRSRAVGARRLRPVAPARTHRLCRDPRAQARLAGYSDFTAFNLAYLAHGGVSFAAPSAGDFGAQQPDLFTVEHFFGLLQSRNYAVEVLLDGPARTLEGRLWGGNLAMLVSLLGTPFMPRVRDGILFVEDVNEPAYKLERMFLQLAHAGVLQRQAAIVLGDFDPVTPMPNDNGYGLPDVIERLRKVGGVPVYSGLPFGHGPRRLTLPVGGRARLVVRRGGPRNPRALPAIRPLA